MSSKIKRRKKEKQNEKEKKKKKKKIATLCLETEHGPRGIWRKSLKPGALNQLVGSHRLSAHYMGGWVRFNEL